MNVLNSYPGKTFITIMNDQGGDVIWRYNPEYGIFVNTGVPFIEQTLLRILGTETKPRMYTAVQKHMQVKTYTEPERFEEYPYVVVMKNGSFNLLTGELTEHSPDYMAKSKIPISYDKNAECPTFIKFLERVLPKTEHRKFWQEWVGYHFLKDYRFQRTVILQGDGDNGKSTLLSVLSTLIGNDNVSTENLFRLTTNRFSPAELYGKMANISADIGPQELKFTGMIKTLTGNDLVPAERKARDPFSFKNHAKLTFSCNQLPKTPDRTLAFYKRFIVLVTGPSIPIEEQDASLIETLTSDEELSGIFNWAIKGLQRALENGKLSEPSDILERKELYQNMSEPDVGFINDYLIESPGAFVTRDEAYRRFTVWCDENGFIPCSEKSLYKTIRNGFYCKDDRKTVSKGQVERGWVGIAWFDQVKQEILSEKTALTDNITSPRKQKQITTEQQIPVKSDKPVKKYPSVDIQEEDKPIIDLARAYLLNNGGKCPSENLVMHLRDEGFEFEAFKRLKEYSLIFKVSNGKIHLLEVSQ